MIILFSFFKRNKFMSYHFNCSFLLSFWRIILFLCLLYYCCHWKR